MSMMQPILRRISWIKILQRSGETESKKDSSFNAALAMCAKYLTHADDFEEKPPTTGARN